MITKKQLLKKIEELENDYLILFKQIWKIKNPPKFKILDVVYICGVDQDSQDKRWTVINIEPYYDDSSMERCNFYKLSDGERTIECRENIITKTKPFKK